MEQLVARRAHNPEAEGSNPSPATNKKRQLEMAFFYFNHDEPLCLLQ
jgi:hypothetical protein